MNFQYRGLAERIRNELSELERVTVRIRDGWKLAEQTADNFYTDSVALNLHGFYSGIERVLQRIARIVDGNLPQGANWHQMLLEQMTDEIPGKRPSVLSRDTYDLLQDYRGFRHVVRNVYTYYFDPVKIGYLAENTPLVFENIRKELLFFADYLDALIS